MTDDDITDHSDEGSSPTEMPDDASESPAESSIPGPDDRVIGREVPEQTVDEWLTKLRARNRAEVGELVLHYPTRNVLFPCDGDTAIRVLSLLAGTAGLSETDPIRVFSDAASCWFVFSHAEVLAASWRPSGALPERVAFDPPPR